MIDLELICEKYDEDDEFMQDSLRVNTRMLGTNCDDLNYEIAEELYDEMLNCELEKSGWVTSDVRKKKVEYFKVRLHESCDVEA